jgi:hypothetical protein
MKITDVEVVILEGPEAYHAPEAAEEAPGVRHVCLIKVSTDVGTQSHVAEAVVGASGREQRTTWSVSDP